MINGSERFKVKGLKRLSALLLLAVLAGCASGPYKPAEQKLPANIKKIGIETFKNSTVYFLIRTKNQIRNKL